MELTDQSFEHEFELSELLSGIKPEEVVEDLSALLGAAVSILDGERRSVVGAGGSTDGGNLYPLVWSLETVGYLQVAGAEESAGQLAARVIQRLMQSTARYLMASDMHYKAIRSDFETLQEKHSALARSEEKYRELTASLEDKVAAQVQLIEASQRQLYQAEKLASVGQLAAGVAHEINNPIGFVRSNLNTAQDYFRTLQNVVIELTNGDMAAAGADDLDYVCKDFSDLMVECISGLDRVAKIIRDLKAFSNVDNAEFEIININEIIRSVCSVVHSQVNASTKLNFEAGEIPATRCQPAQLGQLFYNLILNADQAISLGGKIEIETWSDKESLFIVVKDNGPGIPENVIDKIFDPFFTTREVGHGTGMGLTVCNDIAKAHDGIISVSSVPNQETTFTISIPVRST